MASTRLPGKVLSPVVGRPMLCRVVERARRARRLDEVVVATSDQPPDDAVARLCQSWGVPCVRGSERDVLDRYVQAAAERDADVVVRITADCPLLDPEVVDEVVSAFDEGVDYVSNIDPPTFPDGLDVEVASVAALRRAHREATLPSEREHVTLHIRNHPERYRTRNVAAAVDRSHLRWTVDEPQDLRFARAVYARLGDRNFVTRDVLRLLDEHPELASVNAHIERNEGLRRSLGAEEVTA